MDIYKKKKRTNEILIHTYAALKKKLLYHRCVDHTQSVFSVGCRKNLKKKKTTQKKKAKQHKKMKETKKKTK